jgi:hypothetical protein
VAFVVVVVVVGKHMTMTMVLSLWRILGFGIGSAKSLRLVMKNDLGYKRDSIAAVHK